jgi:redox-sensitive bicupin YhaK (pirin superfamily)
MGPAQLPTGDGIDVRPHPHINLATVTYLFAGAIDHRDSLGTLRTITPGAVNLMTAGHGIVHSERTPADERAHGPLLSGIQTWLAMPSDREEIDPAFEHVAADALPVVEARRHRARHHGDPVGRHRTNDAAQPDDLRRHRAGAWRQHSRSTRRRTTRAVRSGRHGQP